AVELLPKSQWKRGISVAIEDEEDEKLYGEEDIEGINKKSEDAMEIDETIEGEPTGKIVGIIRKKWRPYCGFIVKKSIPKQTSGQSAVNITFRALDRRIPPIKIRTAQAHNLEGNRIVVSIDSWPVTSAYPLGHFVKTLGASGDRETETEVLLLEHDVPYQEFSKAVLADLPPEGDQWRFEFGVHIADVTYFVKPNVPMDKEAAARGTSVYLVDKRIDMLPSLLGTNLCSLRSNVERLAFSCVWEMTENAEIVSVDFSKSIIKSKHSFTYEEAQTRIDDERMQDDVTKGIRVLNKFAKIFRQRRMDAGALTLSSPEVRFNIENDNQDPVDVEMKELKETNALVEEFMLLANISVAKKIYSRFPSAAMLRKHGAPPSNNFDQLRKILLEKNVQLDITNSKTLADSLDKAE
ncbi:exosome catalytic subunit dis3, partial [Rhizopus stolonifer]